ncbi:MAG: hypothetical protein AB1491_04970 [Thermodesulfobacteriota bacterium]
MTENRLCPIEAESQHAQNLLKGWWKRFCRALAVMVMLMLFVGGAGIGTCQDVMIHKGYFKGNDYVGWEKRDRAIYVAGLVDGMLLSPFFDAPRSELESFLSG